MDHDGLLVALGNNKKLFLSNDILLQEASGPIAILQSVMNKPLQAPHWRPRASESTSGVLLDVYETASTGLSVINLWQDGTIKEYAVVVKCELACHQNEVWNVVVSDKLEAYEATMRGLYGKKFKKGAILHEFHHNSSPVRVKTATFGSKLSKDMELCMVESATRDRETRSFTYSAKSLPKEFHDRLVKHSLLGGAKEVVTCLRAEQSGPDKTRVFLYASCAIDEEEDAKKAAATMEKPMQHLQFIVKSLQRLPAVIQRRRRGFQTFIYLGSKLLARDQVKSCKVCGKTFGMLRIEHFCQLCGFRTCSSCSGTVDVEPVPGTIRSNRVCTLCDQLVTNCVFDDEDLDLLGSIPIAEVATSAAEPEPPQQSRSGRLLLTASTSKSDTLDATKWIELLFSSDRTRQRLAMDYFGVLEHAVLEQILLHHISHSSRLKLSDCLLAESDGRREYLLHFEEGLRIPDAPPPADLQEHVRYDSIARLKLISETQPIDAAPFNVVCAIAASVMECSMAYISVVDRDMQFAIAHHNMPLRKLPRKETMCAYALTGDRPLVVRNAFHDIRFREFFCVARTGIRFYASFPIDAPSTLNGGGMIAGLVVCDKEPKKVVTNRQYARMVALAKGVTDLLDLLLYNKNTSTRMW